MSISLTRPTISFPLIPAIFTVTPLSSMKPQQLYTSFDDLPGASPSTAPFVATLVSSSVLFALTTDTLSETLASTAAFSLEAGLFSDSTLIFFVAVAVPHAVSDKPNTNASAVLIILFLINLLNQFFVKNNKYYFSQTNTRIDIILTLIRTCNA